MGNTWTSSRLPGGAGSYPQAVAQFLSPEWLADLDAAARSSRATSPIPLVIEQVVDDEGTYVAYRVVLGTDGARVSWAADQALPPPTVTFRADRSTAAAVHTGREAATAAIQSGRLQVAGDVSVLLRCSEALAALDSAFARVRDSTTT